MPLQSDVIAAVCSSIMISTVDCSSFFYQWRVKTEHCHRLAVISHQGQEMFNVAVMSYHNSPSYVQQMIDQVLQPHQAYSKAYMDDIVIYSKSLLEHVDHLKAIFQTLYELNIALKPTKLFIGYPSVQLLGQKVDMFSLSTVTEKLQAISEPEFPKLLKQLEIYLGMTGYLRQYITFYTQVSAPLQSRKTLLLKGVSPSGRARKVESVRTNILTPTLAELESFHQLQSLFACPTMLTHYDHTRPMFIDLDASQLGIGAMVYHVKDDSMVKLQKSQIQPILFLS